MNITRSVFSSVFRKVISDTSWILAKGTWSDSSQWVDIATWNDGV